MSKTSHKPNIIGYFMTMKDLEDLAILIPSVNCDERLQQTVDRMLSDTEIDGHSIYVVIDGGLIEENIYMTLEKRGINFTRIQRMSGVAEALNIGLSKIENRFVRRMDADDEWIEGSVNSEVTELLKKHGWVFGFVISKAGNRYFKSLVPDLPKGKLQRFAFIPGNPITHPSVCFDSSLIKKIGGYAPASLAEDFELWLRLMNHGFTPYNTSQPTVVYSRDFNLASKKLTSNEVVDEVYKEWEKLVGGEFGLSRAFLDIVICRSGKCVHTNSDLKMYKKKLNETLRRLRFLRLEKRLYMNIFFRCLITIFNHQSKIKTLLFCLKHLCNPVININLFVILFQDKLKLWKFKKAINKKKVLPN